MAANVAALLAREKKLKEEKKKQQQQEEELEKGNKNNNPGGVQAGEKNLHPSSTNPISSIVVGESGTSQLAPGQQQEKSSSQDDSNFSLLPQSSNPKDVPPPIVPFGEYVRHILGLRADSEVGKLSSRCATLYIFRNNPAQLKDLMGLWFQRATMTCKSLRAFQNKPAASYFAQVNDSPTQPAICQIANYSKATEDAWANHMLSILQNCVERYFSKNWDLQKQVVEANTEYRQFQENNDQYLPGGGAAAATNDPATDADAMRVVDQASDLNFSRDDYKTPKPAETPPVTPRGAGASPRPGSADTTALGIVSPISAMPSLGRHTRSNSFQIPTDFTWLTTFDFDDFIASHKSHGAVVIFHAEFSEPSCELLRLLHSMRKKHYMRMHEWERANKKSSPENDISNSNEKSDRSSDSSSKNVNGDLAKEDSGASPLTKENTSAMGGESFSSPPNATNATFAFKTAETPKQPQPLPNPTPKSGKPGTPPPYFPEIFAVDATSEFELFKRFDIRWFPTMIFFTEDSQKLYPSNGVIRQPQFLEEWFERRGLETPGNKIHTKKIKKWVTKAVMLETNKRYVEARQLATTVMMLKRLQCPSGTCGIAEKSLRTAADPPVFIFLGGGMGSGKTTAVTWLTRSDWWKKHGQDTVTVDADAFKHVDPLFSRQASDVHKRSTDAAEQLLVQAVNEGRDIIFDGTMSWEPFVRQTVKMVRDARKHVYKRGPGYLPEIHSKPGAPEEEYWAVDKDQAEGVQKLTPYLVQLIGVSVDPKVGVHRAILRQLASGRNVPVQAQLRSYRYFAQHFEAYADMCDDVIIFNNNVHVDLEKGQSPVPMARKELGQKELSLLDERAWHQFLSNQQLNDAATSAEEVLPNPPKYFSGAESVNSSGLSRQGSTMSTGGGSQGGVGVSLVRLGSDGDDLGSPSPSSESVGTGEGEE